MFHDSSTCSLDDLSHINHLFHVLVPLFRMCVTSIIDMCHDSLICAMSFSHEPLSPLFLMGTAALYRVCSTGLR